jgi:hypothetical protein
MSRAAQRMLFGVVIVLVATALVLHALNWRRGGAVNRPALVNMLGLLVLGVTGALDPPPGRVRLALSAVALALIVPSAVVLLLRAGS